MPGYKLKTMKPKKKAKAIKTKSMPKKRKLVKAKKRKSY